MDRVYLHRKDENLFESQHCTVGGEPVVVDLGSGYVHAYLLIDVQSIDTKSEEALYRLRLQGSRDPKFEIELDDIAIVEFGSRTLSPGAAEYLGRYRIPVRTERNLRVFQHIRLTCEVEGSSTKGIGFQAMFGTDI